MIASTALLQRVRPHNSWDIPLAPCKTGALEAAVRGSSRYLVAPSATGGGTLSIGPTSACGPIHPKWAPRDGALQFEFCPRRAGSTAGDFGAERRRGGPHTERPPYPTRRIPPSQKSSRVSVRRALGSRKICELSTGPFLYLFSRRLVGIKYIFSSSFPSRISGGSAHLPNTFAKVIPDVSRSQLRLAAPKQSCLCAKRARSLLGAIDMSKIDCGQLTRVAKDGAEFRGTIQLGTRLDGQIVLRKHPRAGASDDHPDYLIEYAPQGGRCATDGRRMAQKIASGPAIFISITLDDHNRRFPGQPDGFPQYR